MAEAIAQHKRMAMGKLSVPKSGDKMARGGSVKKGLPISPVTEAKRMNGVPGFKKGGKC